MIETGKWLTRGGSQANPGQGGQSFRYHITTLLKHPENLKSRNCQLDWPSTWHSFMERWQLIQCERGSWRTVGWGHGTGDWPHISIVFHLPGLVWWVVWGLGGIEITHFHCCYSKCVSCPFDKVGGIGTHFILPLLSLPDGWQSLTFPSRSVSPRLYWL